MYVVFSLLGLAKFFRSFQTTYFSLHTTYVHKKKLTVGLWPFLKIEKPNLWTFDFVTIGHD